MKVDNLRNRRKDAGFSRQDDLADVLGWNTETILDIENGRIGIDEQTYAKIEAALNEGPKAKKEEEKQAA